MTGWVAATLVISLATITLVSLLVMALMTWWTTDSASRRWTSAGKQMTASAQTMNRMVEQIAEVVRTQTTLTTDLLLGRQNPESVVKLGREREPEISLNPGEEWSALPDNIRQAMAREDEERAAWQTASEMLESLRLERSNGSTWIEEVPLSQSEQP